MHSRYKIQDTIQIQGVKIVVKKTLGVLEMEMFGK